MIRSVTAATAALIALSVTTITPVASFVVGAHRFSSTTTTTTVAASAATTEEDLLKPTYDIEPITIRIGHGFDIHKMAPIGDAGQPIVIGGVVITHKDQKVRSILFSCGRICRGIHLLIMHATHTHTS
jgi:hypothetical protein